MSRLLLKKCIPPIFLDFLQRDLRPKTFETWEEAERMRLSNGYENNEIAELVAYKTAQQLKKGVEFSNSALQTISAIGIVLNELKFSPVSVLDIGGACGMHYHQVKHCFPETDFNWKILETEFMAHAGEKIGNFAGLEFCCNLENFQGYHFIHCSGTLGYIKESDQLLDSILASGCEYILLSRIMVVDQDEALFVAHRHPLSINGPGAALPPGFKDRMVSYPSKIFSSKVLNDVVKAHLEYEIIFSSEDPTAVLTSLPRSRGVSFLLRKKSRTM